MSLIVLKAVLTTCLEVEVIIFQLGFTKLLLFSSEPGFPNGRPPKSPEDQMKFDKLKARKARLGFFHSFSFT